MVFVKLKLEFVINVLNTLKLMKPFGAVKIARIMMRVGHVTRSIMEMFVILVA